MMDNTLNTTTTNNAGRPAKHERDGCKLCLGAKGGVPGNENRVGGVVVCDYCTSLLLDMKAAGWFGDKTAAATAPVASPTADDRALRAVDALDGMGFGYDEEIGWLPPALPESAAEQPDGVPAGLDIAALMAECREAVRYWEPLQPFIDQYDAAQATPQAECWTCFHCNESFTDREAAALHFGRTERQAPLCGVSQQRYREMEQRMEAYNAEDADIHRQMHAMENRHQQALRRAEEEGYVRGLRDAVRFPQDAAASEPSASAKCPVCNDQRVVYNGPVGDPPAQCEACFDQEPAAAVLPRAQAKPVPQDAQQAHMAEWLSSPEGQAAVADTIARTEQSRAELAQARKVSPEGLAAPYAGPAIPGDEHNS